MAFKKAIRLFTGLFLVAIGVTGLILPIMPAGEAAGGVGEEEIGGGAPEGLVPNRKIPVCFPRQLKYNLRGSEVENGSGETCSKQKKPNLMQPPESGYVPAWKSPAWPA
jgi:hypothetical protein